jgi:glycerol uptake facilitator-like aquaporin
MAAMDDSRNNLSDTEEGDIESRAVPKIPSDSSKKSTARTTVRKLYENENPWALGITITAEFLAVMMFGLVIQMARGFSPAEPVIGALAIGGGFIGIYFFFSTLYTPVHLNPIHTLLHMICKNEGIMSGFLRIVVQLAGSFAATGISRALLDANYINTAIKLGAGISSLEGLFVETMGEVFFGLVVIQLALYGERGVSVPLSALILGIAVIAFQAVAFPVTAASFNMFRWLSTNAVGGNTDVYFTSNWWVYLLSPLIAFVIVLVIHFIFKWMIDSYKEYNANKANYQKIQ